MCSIAFTDRPGLAFDNSLLNVISTLERRSIVINITLKARPVLSVDERKL